LDTTSPPPQSTPPSTASPTPSEEPPQSPNTHRLKLELSVAHENERALLGRVEELEREALAVGEGGLTPQEEAALARIFRRLEHASGKKDVRLGAVAALHGGDSAGYLASLAGPTVGWPWREAKITRSGWLDYFSVPYLMPI